MIITQQHLKLFHTSTLTLCPLKMTFSSQTFQKTLLMKSRPLIIHPQSLRSTVGLHLYHQFLFLRFSFQNKIGKYIIYHPQLQQTSYPTSQPPLTHQTTHLYPIIRPQYISTVKTQSSYTRAMWMLRGACTRKSEWNML